MSETGPLTLITLGICAVAISAVGVLSDNTANGYLLCLALGMGGVTMLTGGITAGAIVNQLKRNREATSDEKA